MRDPRINLFITRWCDSTMGIAKKKRKRTTTLNIATDRAYLEETATKSKKTTLPP